MENLGRLASQGRAHSAIRPWSAEELEAWLTLQKERSLSRINAANHVRNGIMTVEDFDKATKKGFVPKTMDKAHEEAEEELKKRGPKALKRVARKIK